jgi:hypothetical protein
MVSLLACGAGYGDQIWDRPEYRPSSDLVLGPWTTVYSGVQGFGIADPFQINLLYQAGIDDGSIEALNDFNLGSGKLNFDDNEQYVFAFDPDGNLPVYTYPTGDTGTAYWTLTGWHQSIFAGSMEIEQDELGNDVSVFFRVDPAQGYRPFDGDLNVNNVEVFSGIVLSEVVGYRYYYNSPIVPGEGSVLHVELAPVPEPASMAILGMGLVGLVATRMRKRQAV